MKKKIAIVGTTSSLVDAPYNDPEWEIWGLNGAYQAMPRWDKWFDMHGMEVLKKHHQPEYFTFLKAAGDKAMLAHKSDELPEAKLFPAKELVDKYGRYFTNTVAWLTAYAIEELLKRKEGDEKLVLGIWGVNMAMDTEYSIQRPSCEYFLGVAEGKGIDVIIPETSEMLKCSFLYGVEPIPAYIKKMPDKKRELMGNYNEIMTNIDNGQGYMNYITGYMKSIEEIMKYTEDKSEEVKEIITKFHLDKTLYYKPEAEKTEKELKELLYQKSYCNGALDMHSYNMKNWSY